MPFKLRYQENTNINLIILENIKINFFFSSNISQLSLPLKSLRKCILWYYKSQFERESKAFCRLHGFTEHNIMIITDWDLIKECYWLIIDSLLGGFTSLVLILMWNYTLEQGYLHYISQIQNSILIKHNYNVILELFNSSTALLLLYSDSKRWCRCLLR